MRIAHIFLFLAVLVLCAAAPYRAERPDPDSAPLYSEGMAAPAVSAEVSQLARRPERSVVIDPYNADEEEVDRGREAKPPAAPRVIRQHHDEVDANAVPDSLQAAATAAVAPPQLTLRFAGIGNTGDGQPDSIIAVGPTRVMVAVNPVVAIYTRSGQRTFQTSFDDWFSPLEHITDGALKFDPRVMYDQYTSRYVFTCTARGAGRHSWILLSVSKTPNPEGPWAFWALDMQVNGSFRASNLWADFPRLGVDQRAIYITANMYSFTYQFHYSKIRVLKKSDILKFGALPWVEFRQMIDSTGVYAHSIEPAHSYGQPSAEFLVNANSDSGNSITLWKIFQDQTNTTRLARISVPVTSYTSPPLAQQRGGGAIIVTATEGTGPLSVIFRLGSIYTVFPVAKNWRSGPVSALRYYQLTPTGAVTQEVTYGADGVYYYMPSVAVDPAGNVVMAFSRSSSSQFAGFYYAGRKATDPPGKFSPSFPVQQGLASYQIVFRGSNYGRWGDYNGIAAAGDGSLWAYGQYAATHTEWQTVVGRLKY